MDIANGRVITAVEEACPVGGVAQIDIVDPDVLRFAEIEHLGGTPCASIPQTVWFQFVEKGGIIAVDSTAAADDDIVLFETDDKMATAGDFVDGEPVLRTEISGVIVLRIGASQKRRSGLQLQSAIALKIKGSREISPWREAHDSACVDGFLNGCRVFRDAVADGAEISDVIHALPLCFPFFRTTNDTNGHEKVPHRRGRQTIEGFCC